MTALTDRFLRYVAVDTQSDPSSNQTPSTEKQWVLARMLAEELKTIGMSEVTIDTNAYVMATLPSNVEHHVPTIGFIAHIDTSPDFSGKGVKPQIITNYDGGIIPLKGATNKVLDPQEFKSLKTEIGHTLITTDGTTLLGADDKAGIAEIVTAMAYLIAHPEIKHGPIRVAFNPDEEIGRGAHKFDVKKFSAQWAYTMDGSKEGELEYENFNAAGVEITIEGKIVHPGFAKGLLVNAISIANEFLSTLPQDEVPEQTAGREGFFYFYNLKGRADKAFLEGIIRDHDSVKFHARKTLIETIVESLNTKYNHAISLQITDQYANMKSKILPVMHIVDIAERAMNDLGITPIIKPIRGGTDGAQLSFMGLPCPNIFAGGMNFHGPYEYVAVERMQKATDLIIKIAERTAEHYIAE